MSNHSFRCFRKNKNDLTNQQKSRTIKVKRAHQQTVCSHCLWLRRNNRRELVASGRLFPFMVMMIGKQNCCLNQCKYEPRKKAQLLPCYKILHVHHLPSIIIILGAGIDRLPFQVCPQNPSIPHFAKNVKQKQLQFFGKKSP